MMRGAILGAGNVAVRGHLPGWLAREGVSIVAAADPRPDGRAAFLAQLPDLRWYDSVEALLARERLDFADICAPPAMHAALVRAALEAGLHVLCEKPLVLAPEELLVLADLARKKNLVLATVHNWHHAPILTSVRQLLREGAIGEVRSCRWETLRERPAAAAGESGKTNWRVDPAVSGGGILMDHGWHALYLVCGWLPGAPSRVAARLSSRRYREWPIEDTAEVFLESEGGARAEIFLTWAAAERRNRAAIEATRGAIRTDGNVLELSRPDSPGPAERREFSQSLSEGSQHPEWFADVAAEFLSEIGDPTRRGRTLEEASVCLELIALARESSRRGGQPLSVPPAALSRETRERSVVP